jgi:hypothetical protein
MRLSMRSVDYGHGLQLDGDNELMGEDRRRTFIRVSCELTDPAAIRLAASELRRFAQWLDNMAAKEREQRGAQ